MDKTADGTTLNHQLIRSQLERILEHPEFHATEKMRDFLGFVVEETLAGNARQLKGFTIATEVFGRDEDFDPAHDPVVRIQAGRLRRALERYYLVAGTRDPVYIDIPKGGYVPVFSAGCGDALGLGEEAAPLAHDHVEHWPGVLVHPFENLAGREDLSYLAAGLATELSMGLASSGDLRVMLFREEMARSRVTGSRPDFIVRGNIREDGETIKLVIQLESAPSGELLWSDSQKFLLEDGRLIGFQEKAAAVIAAHIAGQHGVIFRTVTRKPEAFRGNYGAILKGYAYHQRFDPESYQAAYVALREANSRDATCGMVCAMLALLYVDNISLEFFDTADTPLAEAQRLANEAVRLLPQNQFARIALARVHLLNSDLQSGLRETAATSALAPDSVLFMDVIGYLAILFGDWERGERLIRRAMKLNPFYHLVAHYATWFNYFRKGEYEAALREARRLAGVGFFWDPLIRAANLGRLGRFGESRAAAAEVLAMKPDFVQRGNTLIRHYIKFDAIRQDFIDGLAAGGLVLDSE